MPKKKTTKQSSYKKSLQKKQIFPYHYLKTIIFFVIGFALVSMSITWHIYEITKYSFMTSPVVRSEQEKRMPVPTYIRIVGTTMNFPVFQTSIQHGVWQIADNGASHLVISANPGENGTIIIYAHNTLVRFGSLPFVYKGQKIILTTQDGKTHTYAVGKTVVASPTDTEVLMSKKGEVLVLYTCYGFADLERFVVFAYPTKS